ncbi:CPBP family intramembrane glutamic endopeptidase [Myceligenerans pegani]|uniref:CPBP family intramembrane metalloprotease n=1 Tax=Myceligenerans pegani TaxID=2776917 RepID=A0ABR9MWH7_9MICO|nr:type II CAAX endopeptidase family protein [Myceligenerans sp. TRM 65318]MBE1875470.1 CPBP family intramembrane metalloprotease [Myceligenerans sp. TRM 65318]MBE3017741.1 CPBP family intramembrane metalloprotease [Myceligenerans sp. TRM 65318]
MTTSHVSPTHRIVSAAWRIGVAMLALAAGLVVLMLILPAGPDPSAPRALAMRISGGLTLTALALGVTTFLVYQADHKNPADIGLGSARDGWRLALWGALVWLVPSAATFAVLALVGASISVTVPAPELAQTVLLLLLAVLLAEAIPEEVVFRGYVTTVLGTVTRGWWVITIQAVLFTLFAGLLRQHWDPMDLSLFLAMGIGFGYLRMITGSVWMPIGFHTAFQTGSQLVLTHDAVEFAGGQTASMLALGAVPFAVAAITISTTGLPRFARPRRAPHDG